jgi:4-methyl-5(b-hydroxyethyl)-thiazole monophosphate biosynthesis
MSKVAVLFAEGFEEIEAVAIVDVLRRAGVDVQMAGVASDVVVGANGISVNMDATLDAVKAADLDGIVLPGGIPGATNLRDNADVLALVREVHAAGKVVGAICAAPIALEAAGLLDGKSVTCYPSFDEQLSNVNYTSARVEQDGRIITGKGPGAAIEFGLKLVEELVSSQTASDLHAGMIVA